MRRLVYAAVLVLGLAARAHAQALLDTEVALTGLFNLYAPTVLQPPALAAPRMWIGGWRTPQDIPDDKIYLSDLGPGGWSQPALSFQRAGAGVNDPSVVPGPGGTLLLFYTLLDSACRPQPNCIFTDNQTGLAVSADGGTSWVDRGILISTADGPDHCGAWAPSAVAVGAEVWVYYHGGNPSFGACERPTGTVFRTRFDAAGQRLDTVVVPTPLPLVNVDVSVRPDGVFVLLGNSTDLTKVYRLTSPDGLAWTGPAAPLVDAGLVWIPTPHATWIDAGRFDVWVGWGEVPGNGFIDQVLRQQWQE